MGNHAPLGADLDGASSGRAGDRPEGGNATYIPAAPYCAKNAAYANDCGKAFPTGESPSDFAPEHCETT